MFYPTPVLFKRTAVRLKGFKPPAIKLLKETMDFVHPSTMTARYATPHWEPEAGLSNHEAWQKLNMPIIGIQKQAGLDVKFQGEGSGHQTENEALEPIWRHVGVKKVWGEREEMLVEDGKTLVEGQVPEIVRRKQKKREGPLYLPASHLLDANKNAKTNPPRYKPPATEYWQHSVYSYNKGTAVPLPVTAQNSSKILRAYFNRVPSDIDLDAVLPQLSTPQSRHTSVLRAYLSEKSSPRTNLHPSLLGKLSTRGKQDFYHPWRKIREGLPEVTYKHYPGGEVGIQAFVYDRRIEALKQKREKVAKEILGMVVAGKLVANGQEVEDELIRSVSEKL